MHFKHLVPLTHTPRRPGALPTKTKENTTGGTLLCIAPKCWVTNTHTHLRTHSELRIPRSMAFYLQATMPQEHKADDYSFETRSTTRPLNPWLLTYIPLTLNIGHKTSCLYLFISFLPSPRTVNHRNLNNPLHIRNNILEQRARKDNWGTRAMSQWFDSSTNHTLILWG